MAVHLECYVLLLDLARSAAISSFNAHGYFVPADVAWDFIWNCDEDPTVLRLEELGWAVGLSAPVDAFEREYSAFAGAFYRLQGLAVNGGCVGRSILLAARLHLVDRRMSTVAAAFGNAA